jgi:hypothetical protein
VARRRQEIAANVTILIHIAQSIEPRVPRLRDHDISYVVEFLPGKKVIVSVKHGSDFMLNQKLMDWHGPTGSPSFEFIRAVFALAPPIRTTLPPRCPREPIRRGRLPSGFQIKLGLIRAEFQFVGKWFKMHLDTWYAFLRGLR